jgi:hypothetical protein
MFKRFLTILTTVLIMIGPTSCLLFYNCGDTLPFFKIEGLEISNYRKDGTLFNPITTNSTTSWDSFFMSVDFQKTFHSYSRKSGGSNLFATDCDWNGSAGTIIGLDTIFVVTLNNYNIDFVANDTINNILGTPNSTSGLSPLSEYIQESKEGIRYGGIHLKLNQPPSVNLSSHQFKIIFILKNGEVFEQTNEPVLLTL